jgi:hypothetical protein
VPAEEAREEAVLTENTSDTELATKGARETPQNAV